MEDTGHSLTAVWDRGIFFTPSRIVDSWTSSVMKWQVTAKKVSIFNEVHISAVKLTVDTFETCATAWSLVTLYFSSNICFRLCMWDPGG